MVEHHLFFFFLINCNFIKRLRRTTSRGISLTNCLKRGGEITIRKTEGEIEFKANFAASCVVEQNEIT